MKLQIVPAHSETLEEHLKIAVKGRVMVVADLGCCFSRGWSKELSPNTNSSTKDGTLIPSDPKTNIY